MAKIIILFLFFCAISISVYGSTLGPKEALDLKINDVSSVLNNPKFDDETEKQIANKIICKAFCLKSMSSFILRERWDNLNEIEKENFTKHLSGLITNFYVSTIKKYYEDCSIKHLKTTSNNNNKCSVHIRTTKRGKNMDIIYSMLYSNETWVIYDIKIQGVSMLRNYQVKFAKCKNDALQAIINPT